MCGVRPGLGRKIGAFGCEFFVFQKLYARGGSADKLFEQRLCQDVEEMLIDCRTKRHPNPFGMIRMRGLLDKADASWFSAKRFKFDLGTIFDEDTNEDRNEQYI